MISLQESHLIHRPSAMMTLLPVDSSFRLNQAAVTYLLARTGDVGRRSRSRALSSAVNLPTSSTSVDARVRPSARRAIGEPTAAPSATPPTAAPRAGALMPNPAPRR